MGTLFVRTAGMLMLLAHAGPGAVTAPVPTGTIEGRVTDVVTGQPLNDAEVSVVGTELSALTNTAGRYSLSGIPAGEHTVKVAVIGHRTQRKEVTVTAGWTTTVDFELRIALLELEEIVVTGVAGEVRRRRIGEADAVGGGRELRVRGDYAWMRNVSCCFFSGGRGRFNTESYAHIVENDFRLVSTSPLSTFSIDVDRASYANVRRFIQDGGGHPPTRSASRR